MLKFFKKKESRKSFEVNLSFIDKLKSEVNTSNNIINNDLEYIENNIKKQFNDFFFLIGKEKIVIENNIIISKHKIHLNKVKELEKKLDILEKEENYIKGYMKSFFIHDLDYIKREYVSFINVELFKNL